LAEDNVILDADADWEKTNSLMASGQLAFWTALMGEETVSMEVYQVGRSLLINTGSAWHRSHRLLGST
jgi:hypothetical protein